MKCPFCKEVIDDDSHYCDQCGKELKFCPECRQPKRGTECPACGAELIGAAEFFAPKSSKVAPKLSSIVPKPETEKVPKQEKETASTPTLLEGDGYRLTLQEGLFGRTTGIYPEFSSNIYVSGRHGELRCQNGQWQIRDLDSHNGTYLNGSKLSAFTWTDLNLGDKLKIATVHLTVK